MTTVDLETVSNIDIRCEGCNRSNSLLEAARRDARFEFEFQASHWMCILRSLTSSHNSMKKAADKSEVVSNVIMPEMWRHRFLLKKIKKAIEDEYGYVKSSDKDSLKMIDKWIVEDTEY